MRDSVANSPLPPSIEKAYHQKCIELKRRLNEIEEANEASRLRKHRLDRAIAKMRVNRAFLLEQLAKSQRTSGGDDSDRSSSPPPTPQDRPPRMKRNYNRRSSPSGEQGGIMSSPPPPQASGQGQDQSSSSLSRQASAMPGQRPTSSSQPHESPPKQHTPEEPSQPPEPGRRATNEGQARQERYPLIQSLPNGTSVLLVGKGSPKPGPWTIEDLHPRHRVKPAFDDMPIEQQKHELRQEAYLPYDVYGRAVLTSFDPNIGKYRHVFPEDPEWRDPVSDGTRNEEPTELAAKGASRQEASPSRARLENGTGASPGAAGAFTAANR